MPENVPGHQGGAGLTSQIAHAFQASALGEKVRAGFNSLFVAPPGAAESRLMPRVQAPKSFPMVAAPSFQRFRADNNRTPVATEHACARDSAVAFGAIIRSNAGKSIHRLSDCADSNEFDALQVQELALRAGCGRGALVADLAELQEQASYSVGSRVIDPKAKMKEQIVRVDHCDYLARSQVSGSGVGVLANDAVMQQTVTHGYCGLRRAAVDEIKQHQLGTRGGVNGAIQALPKAFDYADFEQQFLNRFGDAVVVGGEVGVSVIEDIHTKRGPAARAIQTQQWVNNPEHWSFQSVTVVPISRLLDQPAIQKLKRQPAGRAFLAAQHAQFGGVSKRSGAVIRWRG